MGSSNAIIHDLLLLLDQLSLERARVVSVVLHCCIELLELNSVLEVDSVSIFHVVSME